MKLKIILIGFVSIIGLMSNQLMAQPYWGTIFIDSTIVTANDPTTHISTTYTGQGMRTVYDRRIPGWITINAYLFDIVWSDGLTCEAQINPEFGSSAAAFVEADKYGVIVGRLPTCLRQDVHALWIHMGTQPFGGGNHSILIHTGQTAVYEAQGILEETLIHESSHTSLDSAHANAPGWIAAQNSDVNFISNYAATNPTTEDVAESFLTWVMVRQCIQRVSQQNFDTISYYIPNRLAYFDSQNFNMFPLCITPVGLAESPGQIISLYPNPAIGFTTIKSESDFHNAEILIYDNLGQVAKEMDGITGNEIVIETRELKAGIYFIQVLQDKGLIYHKKLLVMY